MGYNFDPRRQKRDNPEGKIQLAILKYLIALGAVVGKTKTMGVRRGQSFCFDPYTMRGKSDLEAFFKGIMYCIEVKAPGKKIAQDSDQDNYRRLFHAPPLRIFIEADSVEKVEAIIH